MIKSMGQKLDESSLSSDRLMRFGCDYFIHVVISSRATDVRKKVDFGRLMGDTLLDRNFGWGQPIAEAKD